MATLLEKTRKINRLLQRSGTIEYDEISRMLSNVLDANVYITNEKGKIFGHAFVDEFECDLMVDKVIRQGSFPKRYVNWLLRIDETSANMRSKTGMCAYDDESKCLFNSKNTTVVPIYGVGERIGTLIMAKYDDEFTDDDLLLAEYGATVVGMEMLRDHTKKIEIDAREKATVQIALATLSFSELEAAINIFEKLKEVYQADTEATVKKRIEYDERKAQAEEAGDKKALAALEKERKKITEPLIREGIEQGIIEGLLVASQVADKVQITRSVIVNALRKFESAGIIESKSLGMKGTHIKVRNGYLLKELEKLKH